MVLEIEYPLKQIKVYITISYNLDEKAYSIELLVINVSDIEKIT